MVDDDVQFQKLKASPSATLGMILWNKIMTLTIQRIPELTNNTQYNFVVAKTANIMIFTHGKAC